MSVLFLKDLAIRRVADDGVEAAAFHDVGELGVPIEGVDAREFIVVEQPGLAVVVEVGADQAVAALDVAAEIGQGADDRL